MARIRNKNTGQVIDVPDEQLQNYGISSQIPPATTQNNTPTMQQPAVTAQPTEQDQPDYITGHSLKDHATALSRAKANNDKTAIKQITDDYNRELEYQKDFVIPAHKDKLTAQKKAVDEQKKSDDTLNSTVKSLDLFEKNFNEAGLRGPLLGLIPSGTHLSPESADFDAQRETLAYQLAKSIGGQSGQGLSDKDFKNYLKLVPSRTDTPQEAANKMNNIRQMVSAKYNGSDTGQANIKENDVNPIDVAKNVGNAVIGSAKNVAQDINAGVTAHLSDPVRRKAAEEAFKTAQGLEERAAKETDPEKKKQLLADASTIYQSVSQNAQTVSKTFSPDVEQNPALRGVTAASQVVGAADVIANPMSIVNAVRHPIDTVKGTASVVRHPIDFLKQDVANSFNKADFMPKSGVTLANGRPAVGSTQPEKPNVTTSSASTDKYPLNVTADTGSKPLDKKILHSVRQIDLPPSVYGHGKEEAVNKTLDELGFHGDAAEQYAMLEPKMSQIGDKIDSIMAKNPKTASVDSIIKDFDKNLQNEGIYRTAQMSRDTAQKEARAYISDLMNGAGGNNVVPESISDTDLFKLKQAVNKDYKSVARKLETGNTSLSDREKVIYVARQTLDDALSQLHPEVKDLTRMQSHLYDAAESLHKSRGASGLKTPIPGFKIPAKVIQKVKDVTGRIIQG